MSELLAPGVAPSFPHPDEYDWPVDTLQAIKPYDLVSPLAVRPVRVVPFVYKAISVAQREYFLSFFHAALGPVTEFLWATTDPVWAPRHAGPALDEVVVGGAPGSSRTYYVKYSWYDSVTGQETTPSPVSSKLVQGGRCLVVKANYFPAGVKAFRIYAHATQGSECLQAFSTTRSWTEPVSGLVTGTALPKTTNTLQPALKFRLTSKLQFTKITANKWRLEFTAEQIDL